MRKANIGPTQDVVIEVEWSILAVNESGFTGHQPRKTELSAAEAVTNSLVPYADLTEEVVLQWCLDELPPGQLARSKAQIENQISDREKSAQRVRPEHFPWRNKP